MDKLIFDKVNNTVKEVLDIVNREALKTLMFESLEGDSLKQAITRLSLFITPAYLPIARDSDGILAIHLSPERSIELSPFVYIYNSDYLGAEFVCSDLTTLPRAMWLRNAAYFTEEVEEFKEAIDLMAADIAGAKPIPDYFWENMDESFSRWGYRDDIGKSMWVDAEVGHYYADIPYMDSLEKSEKALTILTEYIDQKTSISTELLSIFIGTLAKNNKDISKNDVLKVLQEEAWRGLESEVRGYWKIRGEGMTSLDRVMKSIPNLETMLRDTVFSPLIETPDAYSGENKKGFIKLLKVAVECKKSGDYELYLKQIRNTTMLMIMCVGEYDEAMANLNIDACQLVNKNSIATDLAVVSRDLKKQFSF